VINGNSKKIYHKRFLRKLMLSSLRIKSYHVTLTTDCMVWIMC